MRLIKRIKDKNNHGRYKTLSCDANEVTHLSLRIRSLTSPVDPSLRTGSIVVARY